MFLDILITIFYYLLMIIPLLISVAYFTAIERHMLAAIQRRQGPNVVGFFGILQPLCDGLKLFLKECLLPKSTNFLIFMFAPAFTFCSAVAGVAIIPTETDVVMDSNLGILYTLAFASFSVHTIILSGWSSNSKYAFLGALRSSSQILSYELAMGLSLFPVLIMTQSFNLTDIVMAQIKIWNIIPLLPCFIIFFICGLAETNRHPFDLPEAEAELVAGYNIEYSAITFALFFLAEYSNIIIICILMVLCFFGGWLPIYFFNLEFFNFIPSFFWLALKSLICILFFIYVRGVLPRYRYDQLMNLGWKLYIPAAFLYFLIVTGILIFFDYLA